MIEQIIVGFLSGVAGSLVYIGLVIIYEELT
jgi:hypothetical protein